MKHYFVVSLLLFTGIAQGAASSTTATPTSTSRSITTSTATNPVISTALVSAFLASKDAKPVLLASSTKKLYLAKHCHGCNALIPSDCSACNALAITNSSTSQNKLTVILDNKPMKASYQFNHGCSQHLDAYYCSACTKK